MKYPIVVAAAFLMAGCASTSTSTSTPWPPGIASQQPAVSQSPRKATWPDMQVVAPGSGVSPDKARWSGKWVGWACQNFSCDTKLVVLSVTNEGAKVVPLWAGSAAESPHQVRDAVFVGDELQVSSGDPKFIYRMRKNGQVEMMRTSGTAMGYGVMTKAE